MTSAPHLLNEDRPDFEHVLDDALRIVLDGTDGASGAPLNAAHLNTEQLRTMALAAAETIRGHAAHEYEAFRRIRAETREAARESAQARENRAFGYAAMGVADGAGSGAGLFAIMAVLTPILAGAAAAIFLLIGYALHGVSPEPGIAAPLRTAGWFFAAVAAAAVIFGGIGLILTALRDGSSSSVQGTPEPLPPEVMEARELWHRALLDRGLLPFLDEALAAEPVAPPTVPSPASRMPRLGYSRPDFSSPQDSQATSPRFTSPDFSSPDFGGPDHRPD
jgi:hypothetical protein